ncbi:MBL fold metallo-hydrolase RNA specificity domain-containing protein [Lentiprolixibacter aurantiacus]|uniref:MBL fold metallo-hydrolase n=1 Tax=Lentiprolixibacter aurantiacus TaxID=2993939 RepID=A0AAE3SNT2_9FLAO|nr:MBL fold metallo-hydrolase [Lentiprolixibacter aurantiacus]MCX2720102.1 MBL fold metallo-hydrolase [Lentiprolixibacter aurantiacus]
MPSLKEKGSMQVNIRFLGAAGTVTGSKFYLDTPEVKIMVDCGMFQGIKALRELNWHPFPIEVHSIDLVLLTHGHLDHTGYLPRLVREGFKGEILGTAATLAITEIILRDSARIHEEEAEKANEEGYSRHKPALPFYTLEEAESAIELFRAVEENQWVSASENIRFRFLYNGHILGSTYIELNINDRILVFSGDLGRYSDLLLDAPKEPKWADYLFVESTYGNKLHPDEDVERKLAELTRKVVLEGGNLLIPSFAVERLQSLIFILWRLYKHNRIPNIPVVVDSPMGQNVLEVFERFPDCHKLGMADYYAMCRHVKLVSSYRETWEVVDDPRPKIVIAGSGMVTGGRILTYLTQLISRPETEVLLVGYQAEGTRGRRLLEGEPEIKIFGKYYSVNAGIHHIQSLSAHADKSDLMKWLGNIKNIPEGVFLIHGEPEALQGFQSGIRDTMGWHPKIPGLNEAVTIWV